MIDESKKLTRAQRRQARRMGQSFALFDKFGALKPAVKKGDVGGGNQQLFAEAFRLVQFPPSGGWRLPPTNRPLTSQQMKFLSEVMGAMRQDFLRSIELIGVNAGTFLDVYQPGWR